MENAIDWASWFSTKRVAVLGASGFLGRALARLLAPAAREVIAVSRDPAMPSVPELSGSRFVVGDVTASDDMLHALEGVDVVFMMAGLSGAAESWRDPVRSLQQNCGGLYVVLDAMGTVAPNARIVFPSSRLVYGKAGRTPTLEGTPLAPASPYAAHKAFCEQMLALYARSRDLRFAVARMTNPYGRPQNLTMQTHNVLTNMIRAARNDEELIVFGDGTQTRDYIYIDDAAQALAMLAVVAANDVVNIGSGVASRLVDVVREIIEITGGGKLVFREWPSSYAAVETGDFVADTTLAQSLGIRPRYSLSQGLRLACAP